MPPRGRKLMKRVFIGLVIPRCLICTRIRIKRTSAASSARESILVPRDVVVPRGIPRHPRGKSLAPTQPSQPPSSPSFPSSAARGARRHAAPDSLDETLAVRGERALHRRVYRAFQRRGHFVRIRQPLGHRGRLRCRRMTRVVVDDDARARSRRQPRTTTPGPLHRRRPSGREPRRAARTPRRSFGRPAASSTRATPAWRQPPRARARRRPSPTRAPPRGTRAPPHRARPSRRARGIATGSGDATGSGRIEPRRRRPPAPAPSRRPARRPSFARFARRSRR